MAKIEIVTFDSKGAILSQSGVDLGDPANPVLTEAVERCVSDGNAAAVLFWDKALGKFELEKIWQFLKQPVDVWHAGLSLGMGGLPGAMDFVMSTWMLNRDPEVSIGATSWRLSLRACLIRTAVIKKMGWIRKDFKSLEVATLEMGHRWITRGVLMRHVPGFVPQANAVSILRLPFEDELRYVYYRFGLFWMHWAFVRAVLSGYASTRIGVQSWWKVKSSEKPKDPAPYLSSLSISPAAIKSNQTASVSVIIPTIDRYTYLRTLLAQFRSQTVPPFEIIVIDQTQADRRDAKLAEDFKDLPVIFIYLDKPGQCSSRNAGLLASRGEYILFIDDDAEAPAGLIEDHLKNLARYECEVSAGGAIESGIGSMPEGFQFIRQSDIFPTNNAMVHKDILEKSGLFDLAFDQRARADADLGMRLYLSGAQLIFNPAIIVKHHHASVGGLRIHGARVITYHASRRSLLKRQFLTASEAYLALRYFTPRQVREMLWRRAISTLSFRGSFGGRCLRFILNFALLPHTFYRTSKAMSEGKKMLNEFPKISQIKKSVFKT